MQSDFMTLRPVTPNAVSAPERQWYVRLDNTVYGPFDDRAVWTYVQEGRVTAASHMSLRPDNGYQPASSWLEIAHWFQTPIVEIPTAIAPEPDPEPEAPAFAAVMMIMAEINSGREAIFEQTLQSFGDAYRLGEALYMVRCNIDELELRSILGPTLAVNDRLLIADTTHASFAGYNLGTEVDDTLAFIEETRS